MCVCCIIITVMFCVPLSIGSFTAVGVIILLTVNAAGKF